MSDSPVTLSAGERDFLASFLKTALKDARVEEHRTRTLSYRELILEKESIIAGLLQKLGAKPD